MAWLLCGRDPRTIQKGDEVNPDYQLKLGIIKEHFKRRPQAYLNCQEAYDWGIGTFSDFKPNYTVLIGLSGMNISVQQGSIKPRQRPTDMEEYDKKYYEALDRIEELEKLDKQTIIDQYNSKSASHAATQRHIQEATQKQEILNYFKRRIIEDWPEAKALEKTIETYQHKFEGKFTPEKIKKVIECHNKTQK